MSESQPLAVQQLEPAIHRARVEYLTIYEITESDLDALERGSPVSIYMNALVFCFSNGLAFLTTLLTADIKSERTFTVFVVITVVGFLASAVLGLLWWQARGSAKNVAQKIRERLLPIGTRASGVIDVEVNATSAP